MKLGFRVPAKAVAPLLFAMLWSAGPARAETREADFRYSPPWWQTAICLPDDPDKTLVGKEGQLLFDFGGGGVRNFGLLVQPGVSGSSRWLRQQTLSARTPIVQTFLDAEGVQILAESFIAVPASKADGSPAGGQLPERQAVVLLTFENKTTSKVTRQPVLDLKSPSHIAFSENDHIVMAGKETRIASSDPIVSCAATGTNEFEVHLPELTLEPGALRRVALTIYRHSAQAAAALSVERATESRDAARQWWEHANLPFDTVQVPDPAVQGILESCVRNIWQAREIKHGQPAFHVGPTIYRGLWVVDGSFLLETAAMLGRGQDARAGIEYLLSHQKADGSFELLAKYWKENGIVLWAAVRHAMLMQDKEWLRAHWPALQRVVKVIQVFRTRASQDPKALEYRLMPPGFIDGGIIGDGKPEFSNTYWCLAGLKAVIAAAHWLGDKADERAWQQKFDDFYAAYRQAATRDQLKDSFGNTYVPTMMGNLDHHVPARGQWAFCHAVYPGQVFPQNDKLVEAQLAMLGATKVEGMVFDTGWMKEGLWNYFASFYGHALLWQGHGDEAADVLYAFAQHASPTRVWREEQKPRGNGNEEVGDMPHNWASAEFIRLTTHLIELDRGQELHLLEGFPREWAGPGMVTRLNGVLTPFGPLRLEVRVSEDGRSARVKMAKLQASRPAKVVLHLNSLTGSKETLSLPTGRDIEQRVKLGF